MLNTSMSMSFEGCPMQAVTYPAANHERPAARRAHRPGDSRGGLERRLAHRDDPGVAAASRRRPYLRTSRSVNAGATLLTMASRRDLPWG